MMEEEMERCREVLRSDDLKNTRSSLILIAVLTVTREFRDTLGEDRAEVYRRALAKISEEDGVALAHKMLGGLE